jgi:hypothetical protein
MNLVSRCTKNKLPRNSTEPSILAHGKMFLRSSLTEGASQVMAHEHEKYTINGSCDGPCYLKTILIKFYVENFHLRQQLQVLTKTIKELKLNVSTFNDHVKTVVRDLAAGGEVSTDLIVYVFEASLPPFHKR